MLLKQLFDQDTWTYTYLLADPESREAVIIDPVLDRVGRDLKLIGELGLELLYTLDTHIHADHVTGSGELRLQTGAKSGVASVANVECADIALTHGDSLDFGRYTLHVRSTPGHTNGCLTYVVEDDGKTLAFTGDTLFVRGCGRTDFQQGDSRTLYKSVHEQIYSLPDDTLIYPGHDYRGHSVSTVAEEKAHNPRLRTANDESTFVDIMESLTLDEPKHIHEALPANMACGASRPVAKVRPYKELHAESLHEFRGGIVVDVRTPEEFEGTLGHLEEAILVPLSELVTHARNWPQNEPILFVCRTGRRSTQACLMLAEMGFTDVTNLEGGMTAWRALMETK